MRTGGQFLQALPQGTIHYDVLCNVGYNFSHSSGYLANGFKV
jgi:hypothetical protein